MKRFLLLCVFALPAYADQHDGYAPAPETLPEIVSMMKPSNVLRRDLFVRDTCYFYRDSTGTMRPFDFASRERGIPFCQTEDEDGTVPPSTAPAPTSN